MKQSDCGYFPKFLSRRQHYLFVQCERLRKAGVPINLMVFCPAFHEEVEELFIHYQLWLALKWNPKHSFSICTAENKDSNDCIDIINTALLKYDAKSLGVKGQLKMSLIPKTSEYIFRDTATNKQIRNNKIRIGSAQEPDNLRGLPGSGAMFFNIDRWPDSPKAPAEDLVKSITGGVLPRPYTMQVFTTQRLPAGSFARKFYCDSKDSITRFRAIDILP